MYSSGHPVFIKICQKTEDDVKNEPVKIFQCGKKNSAQCKT